MTTEFCKTYRKAARIIIADIEKAMKTKELLHGDPATVTLNMEDIRKRLGGEFAKKNLAFIAFGLECGLFKEGYSSRYTHSEGTIKVRRKKEGEELLVHELKELCDC